MKLPDGSEIDIGGDTNPKLMPSHMFYGALFVDREHAQLISEKMLGTKKISERQLCTK